MDFLNRAYSQLYELYRSMTPGARLSAGLLAVVVVLCLGYLGAYQGTGPDVDLMHGMPIVASQLPAMEAAFAKANLSGYEIRGTSIRVPRGRQAAYMAALADAGALPQDFGSMLNAAVNGLSPFTGRRERDDRMKLAKQAELSLIIRSMKGIENAYVLYDIDTKAGFSRDKLITATASVKPSGADQLDESKVSAIRHLVAGAIAGLKPGNITVSDLNGRTWYGSSEEGGGAEENLYISLKRTYEQDLKAKILNALCFIPNVTVEPSVVLDRERINRVKQVRRAPNTDGERGDRDRSAAQRPNTATVLRALLGDSQNNDEQTDQDGVGLVANEQIERESVGLTPTMARVSVGVPISYFKKVWQERNPAAPGQSPQNPGAAALESIRVEESAKIKRHVAQLLPRTKDTADATELVTVTTFQNIPAEELPVPGVGQDVWNWAVQSRHFLGLLVLVLVCLLVLRSMMRTASAKTGTETAPAVDNPGDEAVWTKQPSHVPPPHWRQHSKAADPSLRDELSDLVEDDPEAAANILRNWIGQVG